MGRRGVTPEAAKAAVRRSNTMIGALAVHLGDADAMLCGLVGRFDAHLEHVSNVIGLAKGAPGFATLNALMLQDRTLFIADTYVNEDPERRAAGRASPPWPSKKCAASGCRPRWPSSRTATTARPAAPRRARCALARDLFAADGARCGMRRRDAGRLGAVRKPCVAAA